MPTQNITLRVVLAGLLVLGGCSSAESGAPAAETGSTDTQDTTATDDATGETGTGGPATGQTGTTVERPRAVDLTAVDPCAVLTALPLADYRLDTGRPPLGGDSSDVFPGQRDCFANGIPANVSLLLVAVTNMEARSYVDALVGAEVTETRAAGFPLTVLAPRNQATCLGVVDVHDGQFLHITYGLGNPTAEPVTAQPDLCAVVPAIAAAAVGRLG